MADSIPRWIDPDTIMIPETVQTGDAAIGDAVAQITSDDPGFGRWAEWLEADGQPRPHF